MPTSTPSPRPLIGITTYRKNIENNPPMPIFGLASAYTNALLAAGGIPVMIPLGLDESELTAILAQVNGLMLPGGGDINPNLYNGDNLHATLRDIDDDRDRVEQWLIRTAVSQKIPLLAICRGHQMFNVALGGTLWQDVASQNLDAIQHDFYRMLPRHHLAHEVKVTPGSCLAGCLQQETVMVNSLHHQGIKELGAGLMATAVAPDGLIEAVEVADHPFAIGVQWHPENLTEVAPVMRGLFEGLVNAARSRMK